MNPFESGSRKVIPAVLIYLKCGDRVLMLHRNSPGRPDDYHSGKWNGLGGKSELDESPLETAQRELHEEAGLLLSPEQFTALGVLQFPNFKKHRNEDWIVFVFSAHLDEVTASQIRAQSDEGSLHWIPSGDLLSLNLWPGDQYFLPLVIADSPFIGTLWYGGPEVLRHWIQKLGS